MHDARPWPESFRPTPDQLEFLTRNGLTAEDHVATAFLCAIDRGDFEWIFRREVEYASEESAKLDAYTAEARQSIHATWRRLCAECPDLVPSLDTLRQRAVIHVEACEHALRRAQYLQHLLNDDNFLATSPLEQ